MFIFLTTIVLVSQKSWEQEEVIYSNVYGRPLICYLDIPIQKKDGTITMCQLKLNKSELGGKRFYTGSLTPDVKEQKQLSVLEQERVVLKGTGRYPKYPK